MNAVNKTLYIPLYGKAYVSQRGLFLNDPKAEELWDNEGFSLNGKARSKWLAYYMGIRAAVFDTWVTKQMETLPDAVVIHIGCGLDSRALRVNATGHRWYDVDFEQVIEERKRHYQWTDSYTMLGADVRANGWLSSVEETDAAIVIMEGVSMYLSPDELKGVASALCHHFKQVTLLMDCYTVRAARLSKYKNPVREVGVTTVYGMDTPEVLSESGLVFVREHDMTPPRYIDELTGFEKHIFKRLYAGSLSKKLYRLFEYKNI